MSEGLPDEVARLVEERATARRNRDFARADDLRARIGELGWEVQDLASGSTARPRLPPTPAPTGYARPEDLESLLDEPATVDATLIAVAEDHPSDLHRLLNALRRHPPAATTETIVVANAPSFPTDALPGGTVVLPTSHRLGWADAANLALRRSRGGITVLLDTSIEPTGDFLTPLLAAFEDERVGIAGGWGVVTDDGRSFREAPAGEVHAIEAYALAVRREALRRVGGFDPHFRFYRNADLDLSFAVRDAGWRAVAVDLPLIRHEHRGWTSLPAAERDRLSKRNFYRFLKHWGDRRDLLSLA